MKFHHDGVVCNNIEEEVLIYMQLGFSKQGDVFEDHEQKIRGQFMINENFCVELLEPLSDDSPISHWLKKNIKIYHHAFIVSNLDDYVNKLTSDNWLLIAPPTPAIAFDNKRIAFLICATGLIVELIER